MAQQFTDDLKEETGAGGPVPVPADGDAYAGEALIYTAGIHYQVDTIGSRTVTAK